jgi:hypothetical protein
VGGWQIAALLRRSRDQGVEIKVPTRGYETLMALKTGMPLPDATMLRALQRGLPVPKPWLLPARALRNLLFERRFTWKSAGRLAPSDVVMLSASDFVTSHAALSRSTGAPVVMCAFWEWFSLSAGDLATIARMPPAPSEILDEVVVAAQRAFANGGEELPPPMEMRLRRWIGEASRWILFYMDRMRARPERIPGTLWYGSVNNWWSRMLRAVVEENGGRNIGHDHGSGIGLRPNEGEHGPCFDLCDEFVSYSPALAEALRLDSANIAARTLRGRAPLFTSAQPGCLPIPRLRALTAPNGHGRTFYISPMYLGERLAGMNCLPSDPVWLDWQCRLFLRLRSQGHSMVFKAHPENILPPSVRLLQLAGADLVSEPIEDCVSQASAFVVDFLSSPFKTIVHTDRPIIIIDHGLGKMAPHVRSIIERRCAIIPGRFVDGNRMDADWQLLQGAFEAAEALRRDRTCANELFGYPL